MSLNSALDQIRRSVGSTNALAEERTRQLRDGVTDIARLLFRCAGIVAQVPTTFEWAAPVLQTHYMRRAARAVVQEDQRAIDRASAAAIAVTTSAVALRFPTVELMAIETAARLAVREYEAQLDREAEAATWSPFEETGRLLTQPTR